MRLMLKDYIVYLMAFALWSNITLSCSSLENRIRQNTQTESVVYSDFELGKNETLIGHYEKAEPLLLKSILNSDYNSHEAKLYLTLVYDQIEKPEKSIIYANEYIAKEKNKAMLLRAHAIRLKNLVKVGSKADYNTSQNEISKIVNSEVYGAIDILNELKWSLNLSCQIYCVEEIGFLSLIQLQFFYLIEKEPEIYDRIADLLISRYEMYYLALSDQKLEMNYRKKMAFSVYEALQKAKNLHLEQNTLASVKTATLVSKLSQYQNKTEQWIYDNQ